MFDNVLAMKDIFITETLNTLYMTVVTAIIAGIIGLAIGVILVVTGEGKILQNKIIYHILDKLVNFFRSIPFIILLALVGGLTMLIVGTRIGETAAIVPLVCGTIPFYARQVENALSEVDSGIVEAAQSMGDSPVQIIWNVYIREGLPSLIRASALTIISLIGLTALSGVVGAGGLGKVAISMGYNRYRYDVTLVATILVVIIVYIVQFLSDYIVKKISH